MLQSHTSEHIHLRTSAQFLVFGSRGEIDNCLLFSGPFVWRNSQANLSAPPSPSCHSPSLLTHMLPVVVLIRSSTPMCSPPATNQSDRLPLSPSSLPVSTAMNGHIIHSDAAHSTPAIYTTFCSFLLLSFFWEQWHELTVVQHKNYTSPFWPLLRPPATTLSCCSISPWSNKHQA